MPDLNIVNVTLLTSHRSKVCFLFYKNTQKISFSNIFAFHFRILAFIRGDFPKKYNNLKIKYVRGVTPQLKLLDENHKVLDDLNIQKWDTDTLEEFLHERLQN